jgi:flagellin
MNLVAGETYTQKQIDDIIANASQVKGATAAPAELSVKLKNAVYTAADGETSSATVAGTRATNATPADLKALTGNKTSTALGSSDSIQFTANTYGTNLDSKMAQSITVKTDVAAGKETVTVDTAATADAAAKISLHLATGVEYTNDDISAILKEAGFDYDVKLTDSQAPDGDTDGRILFNVKDATGVAVTIADGAGVGKEVVPSTGKGLTFQIGANGVEDQRVTLAVNDMSSSSIGVANADVSTQDRANKAIEMVDAAVKTVSMQRAGLGALQNRLEYTVNNLTTTNENLTAAESQIRDTDMASEMINYTKFNILQQASQAMLAQANQQPQSVLQLLG